MGEAERKPRIVYFCHPAEAFPVHMAHAYHTNQLKWLHWFFDVRVVSEDVDFAQCMETHQPDLVLFGTGVEKMQRNFPRITNIASFPRIPRVGYLLSDCYSPSRIAALAQFEVLGVETIFSLDTAMEGHFPWPTDRLFCIPWFVDTEVFRDLEGERDIPVGLLGSGFFPPGIRYPWRGRVGPLLLERVPALIAQRPYGAKQHEFVGDAYVKMLNRIRILLADGGVERRLVRKMLEGPAAGCLLVAESGKVMESAGFKDGENCLFADEADVVDRVKQVLHDVSEWDRIRKNGWRLVHDRHGFKDRRQLRQWLDLNKQKKGNERIVQPDLFGDLGLEPVDCYPRPRERDANPIDECLSSASRCVFEGRINEADLLYRKVLEAISWMAEGRLGVAICMLWRGLFEGAMDELDHTRDYIRKGQCSLSNGELPREDPVGMAFRLVALHGMRRAEESRDMILSSREIDHPALNAARQLVVSNASVVITKGEGAATPSIHPVPDWQSLEWRIYFQKLLSQGLRARKLRGIKSRLKRLRLCICHGKAVCNQA